MHKRFLLLVFVGISLVVFIPELTKPSSGQDDMAPYKNNSCVTCHSKSSVASISFERYTQWFISVHKEKGISCDKCHGGDAAGTDEMRAHAGVIKPSDARSRLHQKNLPVTCSTCHSSIAGSFTESLHYQKLKTTGMGPSCTTCHQHMATKVLVTPEETATLCAHCHDTINGLMPPRPEIPQKANEVMQAIRRANMMVLRADRLLEQCKARNVDVTDEEKEMKIARAVLADAKISWHAFNLEVVGKKANEAFEMSNTIKDALRKKLYPES